LGIGDWGLGIGDWGLGPIPNPQSPIPNPQFTHSIKSEKKLFLAYKKRHKMFNRIIIYLNILIYKNTIALKYLFLGIIIIKLKNIK